jgi:hypothetical protein
LPRFVLGAQPLTPGWRRALVRPNPGPLTFAGGRVPTPLGPISIRWDNTNAFKLALSLPGEMTAQVQVPANENSKEVLVNGSPVKVHRDGQSWTLDADVTGNVVVETR